MAVEVSAKIKPINNKSFAIVDAQDIEMPNGQRLLPFLEELSQRLNNFFDTDNESLDQLSEIITFLGENKEAFDILLEKKVNVADIVDSLEGAEGEGSELKVLSAKQGKVLAQKDALLFKENEEIKKTLNKTNEDFAKTVKIEAQELTEEQKEIARANIGAMSNNASMLPEVDETEESLLFSSGGEWIPISASRFARNSLDLTNLKVSPSTVEVGTQVDSVTISWTTNFPTNSATVNGKVIYEDRKGAGNHSHSDDNEGVGFKLTSKGNQSWKVKVNGDYNESDEGTVNLSFIYKVYYGAMDADGEVNEQAIKAMSSKLMSNTNGDYSITPGTNQKMALAAPSSYSQLKNVIINNNTYTWDKVGENIPVTSNGTITNYNVWMNSKITTAPCTIKVVV